MRFPQDWHPKGEGAASMNVDTTHIASESELLISARTFGAACSPTEPCWSQDVSALSVPTFSVSSQPLCCRLGVWAAVSAPGTGRGIAARRPSCRLRQHVKSSLEFVTCFR
eukprot:1518238-Pleurochrysis_carterae.AAC.2